MDSLTDWIMTKLPIDGWWGDGYEVFINSAQLMLNAGMGEDVIKKILTDCYYAVANEFGS